MKTSNPPSAIATDGLRYTNKAQGSPYGPGIGLTLSCIRCGRHKPRTLLKPTRVAGKIHYCCEEECRPGVAEKKAAAAKPARAAPTPKAAPKRAAARKSSSQAAGDAAAGRERWRAEPWASKVPYELGVSLDNFEQDDKAAPTLAAAVEEAAYIIGLHSEGGTESHAMFTGERGEEEQKEARKTVKDCRAFIRRHKSAAAAP